MWDGHSHCKDRSLERIGAALLSPSAETILYSSFPPDKRAKAIALNVGIGYFFLALGPFLGGILTQYASWRYAFWLNLPIAAFAFISAYYMPVLKKQKRSFEWIGFLTFSLGSVSIVYTLMEGRAWGWSSYQTLITLAFSILMFSILIIHSKKIEKPFLDLTFFKKRYLTAALGSTLFITFIIMIVLIWTIYFQNILNRTPLEAGMVALVAILPVIVFSTFTVKLMNKLGPSIIISSGFLIIGIALCSLSAYPTVQSLIPLFYIAFAFGSGASLIIAPTTVVFANETPVEHRSTMSSSTSTFRNFATSIGMATFAGLFASIHHISLNDQRGEIAANIDAFRAVNLFAAAVAVLAAIFAAFYFRKKD